VGLLSDDVRQQVTQSLAGLTNPVKLVVFTQEMECQFCRENRQLAEEIQVLSPRLSLEVYNFVLDRPQVEKYRIERIPAIVVEGERDYGIRFYGVPAGYEFASLLEAIKLVSHGNPGFSPLFLSRLESIPVPLNLKVFVTLTCPYCAPQVHLAHRLALARPGITAEMIESAEFPVLANRFQVQAVPRTVVNDQHVLEGAMPDEVFLERLAWLFTPAAASPPPATSAQSVP
jgi:glutaredoxin-like protein